MRRASSDYGFINIDNIFVGISLGYDYTAEHEWGIDDLKRNFGIPASSKKTMGIMCRTITKCPPIVFIEGITDKKPKMPHALLYTGDGYQTKEEVMKYIPHELKNYVEDIKWNIKWYKEHPNSKPKDNMITAWDSKSFGVAVMGENEVKCLKELHDAFIKNNITIASINLMPKNPFSNSSLSLLITDRIPKDSIEAMYLADKEVYDRIDYEEKIGMKKLIEKKGNKNGYKGAKYFLACSPKWIDYDNAEEREKIKKKHNTKYDIMYWINYSDDDSNHGWYTVEEIREWLNSNKKLTEIRKG